MWDSTMFLSTLTPKFYVALTGTSSLISGLILIFEWWYFRKYGTSFIEQVSINHISPWISGDYGDTSNSNNSNATNVQPQVPECKVWRNPLNLYRGAEYQRFYWATNKEPLTYYDMNLSAQDHQTFFTCEADAGKAEYEIMQTAWRERNPTVRLKAAHNALEKNPECAPAYILLAEEEATTITEAEKILKQALKVAEINYRKSQALQCRENRKVSREMPSLKDQSPLIPLIGAVSESSLLQRRANSKEELDSSYYKYDSYDNVSLGPRTPRSPELSTKPFFVSDPPRLNSMSRDNMICSKCGDGFEPQEKIVNSTGQLWHQQCFVCAQCFREFRDGVFYEFDGRKYCEHDFQVLFAPCCSKCGEFIIGRVIKAMNASWHPACFKCEMCALELADTGFIKNGGRALCHDCNAKVKARGLGKYICHKCHAMIDDQPLKFRGEVYHPYHFNCTACGVELDASAREVRNRSGFAKNEMNELYCLRCHDKMGIPICGACRRPIEERVVTALGKHWHVEHFVCAKCEKPFFGHRHYEKKGLAYCETHYHQLFGNLCHVCNQVIAGDVFTAMNKAWCFHHFACSMCDQKMNQKTKFYEYDLKPVCKKCYEKFPNELRKRLRRQHEAAPRKPGTPVPA